MSRLLHHGTLLAQGGRLDSLSSRFRGRRARLDAQDLVTWLLVLAIVILAVCALSYLLKLQEQRRRTSPLGLFLSLCKAHRLRWSQWWLLWRVARVQRLRDPARLFLEPERLEEPHLGRALQAHRAQLRQIRDRLFDQLEQGQQPEDLPPPGMPERRGGTTLPLLPAADALDIASLTDATPPGPR